jgi:acetyl/propionyl-CoA carboxylase alpha subunit
VLALGERDCSVQRRHQKVLEETPAPGLDARLRSRLHEAAVHFGQAIGYRGAGTVEFVVDGGDFYFLELNGRIQVEHPVTEAVTGLDLVERQIRIAEGEALATPAPAHGHAVEARLYAEDPRTFLPQSGHVERLAFGGGVRVDSAVEEGDEIGLAYDPMIAKLVAHADTREKALDRLSSALADTRIEGVTTNLQFLRWLVAIRSSAPGKRRPLSHGASAAVGATAHARAGAVSRTPWRLNLPAPPPSSPPDVDVESQRPGAAHGESAVTAPMPGTVIRVEVQPGDAVRARQPLVVSRR